MPRTGYLSHEPEPHRAAPRSEALSQADDPHPLNQVISEIQELGKLDPPASEALLKNLEKTDPNLWPLIAQQVRANLALQRQAAESPTVSPHEMADAAPAAGIREVGASSGFAVGPGQSIAPAAEPKARPGGELAPSNPVGNGLATTSPPTSSPPPPESTPGPPPPASTSSRPPALGGARSLARNGGSSIASVAGHASAPRGGGLSAAKGDWQAHLQRAIEGLESEPGEACESDEELARQLRLRMLYLLGNQRREALAPIAELDPAAQEFWSKELYGLATMLDTETVEESGRRAVLAKQHLGGAISKLGESCPLAVRNLTFVSEIQSYGTYTPYSKCEFEPGEKIGLYAEVENYRAKETARGFHTALRSSYQIFSTGGHRMAEHEFKPNEEYCRSPRRDYFIGYEFSLPDKIPTGKYVLQLTVADLNGDKIGQSMVEFEVKLPEK